MRDKKILIVGQTPPPFHGQAIMQKYLVDVNWDWCKKEFIRMSFSTRVSEVSKFKFTKVVELFKLINQFQKKARSGFELVYYPPAGPKRIPIYRDIILLFFFKSFSKKIILHFHAGGVDQIFNRVSRLESYLIKKAFKKVDAIIVLSEWLKKEIEWCQAKKTFVVGNGIEDVFEKFGGYENLNEVISFLFIGNLKREKGIFTLLKSAALMKETGENFELKFIGSFHSAKEMQVFFDFIKENKLTDCVHYLGPKDGDEKWKEFQKANVLCLPTFETEGMPVSILEAMMFQMPVITTRWRSIPDFIRHEKNGLLFDPQNAEQLAKCMRKMIHSPEDRNRMGVQARKDYLASFTVEEHLKKMEMVFQQVLFN